MTRYVFTTPGTLQPANMPDKDARNSYFKGVTLNGDFTGYDFRNASFADCTLIGTFAGIQHQYMTSTRSDWKAATIPSDISSYKHDLVLAVMFQRRAAIPANVRAQIVDAGITYLDKQYTRSWINNEKRMVDAGLTTAQLRNHGALLLAGFPKLLARFNKTIAGKEAPLSTAPLMNRPATNTIVVAGQTIDLFTDPRIAGGDRWAIERTLEAPGWAVHIYTLYPWPWAIAVDLDKFGGTPQFGWWGGIKDND